MPKRPVELFIVDILVSIDRIKRNASPLSLEDFISDENIFNATMREFGIIGEAAKHLLRAPHVIRESDTEWQKIVDFRNLITHEYFGVIPQMVFEIVHKDVPALEEDLFMLLARRINDKRLVLQAIEDTKTELARMNRNESIAYLDKVENRLKFPSEEF